MRNIRKIVIIFMIIISTIFNIVENIASVRAIGNENLVKIAVVVHDANDPYMSQIIKNLKDIQRENESKVQFTFFDSKQSQTIQDQIINDIVKGKEFNLVCVALVNIDSSQEVINRVKAVNMPIILFQREPYSKDAIRSYERAIYIGTYTEQAGIIQGQIIIDVWNKNKAKIDKNKDNIMQYIMIEGQIENLDTINRTKYSVLTIKDANINVQELTSIVANWNEEQAKTLTDTLLLRYGDKIEVIISNNDAMAIGAIKSLQAIGYNNGDKDKIIPVVGVDAIPEARKMISEGIMTGTVIQNARGMAEAIYTTGINLAQGRKPLDGTDYQFDETGVTIRLPYQRYIPS